MELFKLFGTIAIDNSKAKDGLEEVTKEAKKTENGLENVGEEAKKSESKLEKFGTVAGKVGTSILKGTAVALGAVASALTAVGASAIKYNAEMEGYATSFEVMTGSAEKATETMERLKELGAKTPFEFTDLASATQLLMNYGFGADDAMDKMMMLGDISQGNADKMQRVAMAYGQMSSAGKVSLEDVKQMIEAGFNPLQEISEATGESMESLYDRISKGTISVDEITASMERSTSQGGKYFQSMDKQSKTLAGRMSTLKDTFQQMTGSIFNGMSNTIANKALPMVIAWVEQLATIYEKEGTDGFIEAVGNVFGAILTRITEAIPEFTEMGFKLLNGLLDGISNNQDKIATAVVVLATTLLQGFSSFFVKFTDTGLKIIVSLIQGINKELPKIIQTITNLALQLADVLIENLPLFLEAGLQFIVSLAQGILEALPDLLAQMPEIIQQLVEALLNSIDLIINAGVQLLTALVENLDAIIGAIVAVLPQIITAIVNTLTSEDGLASIIQAGVELLTALIDNMDTIISTIVGAIPQIIDAIVAVFANEDTQEAMIDAGLSIIESLLQGLVDAWGAVTEWASSAVSWLKDIFTFDIFGGFSFDAPTLPSQANQGVTTALTNTANAGKTGKATSSFNAVSGFFGKFAEGGVIDKPTIALMGEAGSEVVMPLKNNTEWMDGVAQRIDSLGGKETANKLDKLIALQEQMLGIMPELANISINLNNREFGRAVRQVTV